MLKVYVSGKIVWPRLGWESSWVDYLEGALYKAAVIIVIRLCSSVFSFIIRRTWLGRTHPFTISIRLNWEIGSSCTIGNMWDLIKTGFVFLWLLVEVRTWWQTRWSQRWCPRWNVWMTPVELLSSEPPICRTGSTRCVWIRYFLFSTVCLLWQVAL